MSKLIQKSGLLSPSDKSILAKKLQKIRAVKTAFQNRLSAYSRKQLRLIEKLGETAEKSQIEKIKNQIGL